VCNINSKFQIFRSRKFTHLQALLVSSCGVSMVELLMSLP
jgi:hypothetical protein